MTTGLLKREIRAVESQWTRIDLTDEDLEALLAVREEWGKERDPRFSSTVVDEDGNEETTKILDVRRAKSGSTEIKVFDAIGAIDLPNTVIVVHPKIPIPHFNYIASHAIVPPDRQNSSQFGLEGANHFLEVVCSWAVNSVEKILRDGLARGYAEERQETLSIRGRVNVTDASKKFFRGNFNFECLLDEFSSDTSLNRVLKQCLTFVAGNPVLSSELQKRAKRALFSFSGVGRMTAMDLRSKTNRNSRHYADAFEFAKNVLEKSGRDLQVGEKKSRSFLYKTPLLIEEGIRRIVETGLKPTNVVKPAQKRLQSSTEQKVTANPDLGFGLAPLYTGDVKYKIQTKNWRRTDLAQAVFFAVAFDSPKALVIDFADEGSVPNGTVAVSDLEVTPVSWKVSQGISPVEARQMLLDDINRWLSNSSLVFTERLKAA
jgi:5-methylcytosine-specific restriction endonuclease McrBC regulatory subunit McrC